MILVSNDHVIFEYDPDIRLIMIDLFAGAGGVTTGVEQATVNGKKICRVICAVNHDSLAIESHKANHPNTFHFIEDVKTVHINKLALVVQDARQAFPNARLIIWASLECTNFSKAKGGLPRDADSRTLANFLFRYLELDPDGLFIENVQEFMAWGPLDNNGKPESMKEGRDYLMWVERMKARGFDFGYRIINSANLGAYTSRTRYFAQFLKYGLSIEWPEHTHAREPRPDDMFSSFKKWKPVKDVLDLNDEGNSIFGRKKELSPKTLERIYAGLVKFVANGDESFISKYYSGRPEHKNISLNGPAATIKTIDGQALVKAVFIQKYNSTNKNGSVNHSVASVEKPSPTITTQVRMNLVQAFLTRYHGKGINVASIDEPASTISTRDRLAVIKTQYIDKQYGSGPHNIQSIESPAGTLLSNPKLNLVTAVPFVLPGNFSNQAKAVTDPCPTIMASRRHHYLVNPQYSNKGSSVEKPCFTLIARMDKKPPYLVTTKAGNPAIVFYSADSPEMQRIKLFMVEYSIIDIKMRMLKIPELKLIMGFSEDYQLMGNQTHQKKFIGNAVETTTARRIIEAFVKANTNQKQTLKSA